MSNLEKPGHLLMVITVMFLNQPAYAEDELGRCVSRQRWTAESSIIVGPAVIPGLEPMVSVPSEGTLKLHTASSDCCSSTRSPVGDLTADAGPYDPTSHRLYLWGFDQNGWIEVVNSGQTWYFGQSGTIQEKLYDPADDTEDVTPIQRSASLGVQFYSGYSAPHWLTGNQSYQVYQISGPEMLRVPELEAKRYRYVGDDLAVGLAVFAPTKISWNWNNPDTLVLYDGTGIVPAPAGLSPLSGWCQ